MDYLELKWLHILSSTILFGTGIGSAFYLLLATLSRDVRTVANVSRWVVLADWLFTTPTVIIQPLTGYLLMRQAGFPLSSPWLIWSVVLYALAIACWLPVVFLQIRMRRAAEETLTAGGVILPPAYWRAFRWWFVLGFPAFFAFVTVFYLMVVKSF